MGDFGTRIKPGEVIVVTAEVVGVAAAQLLLGVGDAPRRISIEFQNTSVNTIYIGVDNAVAANTGRALAPATGANLGDGGSWAIDVSDLQSLWASATGAGSAMIVTELVGA